MLKYFVILSFAILTIGSLSQPVLAETTTAKSVLETVGGQTSGTIPQPTGDSSVPQIIGNIINLFLSFLGVVALVLIIYGGYLWMTARGDTEQVKKARDLLVQAVIGLIIILSSYALAGYILSLIGQQVSGSQ